MTPEQLTQLVRDYSGKTPEQFAKAEVSLTLRWALEQERSVASIIWHYPEYLGLVQRELDPQIHFTIPAYRLVLEGIALVDQKCATADWASVLQCICEIPGAFEECGGLQGLNAIFTDDNHYPEGPRADLVERILLDRIRFLKEAAVVRGVDPSQPVPHYTTGRGFLQKNKLATRPTHPVATGDARCAWCGRPNALAGWPEGEERLALKLTQSIRGKESLE
jgi:hypothetical protein